MKLSHDQLRKVRRHVANGCTIDLSGIVYVKEEQGGQFVRHNGSIER